MEINAGIGGRKTSTGWSFGRQTVGLPISAKLTDDDVQDVINSVSRVVSK